MLLTETYNKDYALITGNGPFVARTNYNVHSVTIHSDQKRLFIYCYYSQIFSKIPKLV